MKPSYSQMLENPTCLAVVDLVPHDEATWTITRINTPREHRGKGIASQLMQECVADADRLGATLLVGILPTGGLRYRDLVEWYQRLGFEWHGQIMRRPPQDTPPEE